MDKNLTFVPTVTVRNLVSNKSGREVANQFEITTSEGNYFRSYRSIIAFRPYDHVKYGAGMFLDEGSWDYSVTTGKYRNQWLGENKAETMRKIKTGEYKLVNLN